MNKKAQFISIIAYIVSAIIMLISVIYLINLELEYECEQRAEIMGFEYKYNLWIDCMIKVDDKWIYADNYIINSERTK
jgi:hypothetical protein